MSSAQSEYTEVTNNSQSINEQNEQRTLDMESESDTNGTDIRFCSKCDNVYYLKMKTGKLIYYCKCCGYEDNTIINTRNFSVMKFKKNNNKRNITINEYTKYDATLPHTNTVKCPNPECKTNASENPSKRDIIVIRQDDEQLKYMYMCSVCDFTWNP